MTVRQRIDDIDVIILQTLLKDPRTSFNKIAKHTKTSINAVRTRFRRLQDLRIIKGSILQINPNYWGYNCIAYLTIVADNNRKEKVLENLKNLPNLLHIFQQIGRININCLATLKNVNQLAHIIEDVKKNSGVIDVSSMIWVDVVKMDHPENLVISPFSGTSNSSHMTSVNIDYGVSNTNDTVSSTKAKQKSPETNPELDNIDLYLLRILTENARTSFSKIAQVLGISVQSVSRRYNRLRETVAPYSSITLDLRKIGYVGTALFLIKASHKDGVSKILERMLKIPNVITAIRTLGNFDLFIAAPFSDFDNIFNLNESITGISGVMEVELLLGKAFSEWPLNVFSKIIQANQKQIR